MKTGAALFSIAAIVALFIAFFAGFEAGMKKMDDFCGVTLQGSSAGAHSESFAKHMQAIDALKRSDPITAERVLRLLARVDAEVIRHCDADPKCRGLTMTAAPDAALMRDAVT